MKHVDLSQITTYQAGATQALVNRKLQKICDEILKPYGITKMQWLIIGTVYDHGDSGLRISELAETLGTTMGYLTNSINLLEARNILSRRDDAQNLRSKLIVVHEDYVAQCPKIEATLREGLRKKIYDAVDPSEFGVYIKIMNELAAVELSDN